MATRKPLTAAAVMRPSQRLTPTPPAAPVPDKAAAPPSRQGKAQISFWTEAEAKRQLKIAAAQLDRTEQEILREALDDWFARQDLPRLASGTA